MNTLGSNSLSTEIVSALQSVIGQEPTGIHEPEFSGNELSYLQECIDSTFVSSVGEFVDRFEQMLAQYTGAKHVVATVNGTAALHTSLIIAGVKQGDEVLVPALTFIATANAVSYCGAIPHFVDSESRTFGVDPDKLRAHLTKHTEIKDGRCVNTSTGRTIRALIPVHVFGHPAEISKLKTVCADFNLVMVEDAAEALGSFYEGQHTGNFGLTSALSFNGNKIITCGGGGAVLTNDPELAKRAKQLSTTAKIAHPWRYKHSDIGYNYRMPNLNAALGCAQIEQLARFRSAKRALHRLYVDAFSNIEEIEIFSEPPGCESNYWLQTLILKQDSAELRDRILDAATQAGVMLRPAWELLDRSQPYRLCPSMDLSCARHLSRTLINLPSSARLASSSYG